MPGPVGKPWAPRPSRRGSCRTPPAGDGGGENILEADSLQGEKFTHQGKDRPQGTRCRASSDGCPRRAWTRACAFSVDAAAAVAAWAMLNMGRQLRTITRERLSSVPAVLVALQEWPPGGPANDVVGDWHVFAGDRPQGAGRRGLLSIAFAWRQLIGVVRGRGTVAAALKGGQIVLTTCWPAAGRGKSECGRVLEELSAILARARDECRS